MNFSNELRPYQVKAGLRVSQLCPSLSCFIGCVKLSYSGQLGLSSLRLFGGAFHLHLWALEVLAMVIKWEREGDAGAETSYAIETIRLTICEFGQASSV